MVILMAAFGQTGHNDGLDKSKLEAIWRMQYGIICVILLGLTIYRAFFNKETDVWQVRLAVCVFEHCWRACGRQLAPSAPR